MPVWSWALSCSRTVAGDRQKLLHGCAWRTGWEDSPAGFQGNALCAHGSLRGPPAGAENVFTWASALQVIGSRETELDYPFGLPTDVLQGHMHLN